MRNPEEVRYALYDFGSAVAYPEDSDIEEIQTTRFLNFYMHNIPPESVNGSYNPFKADMAFVRTCLQRRVRVRTHLAIV